MTTIGHGTSLFSFGWFSNVSTRILQTKYKIRCTCTSETHILQILLPLPGFSTLLKNKFASIGKKPSREFFSSRLFFFFFFFFRRDALKELSNAYLLAKFGFDTAENEPCQVCPIEQCSSQRPLPLPPPQRQEVPVRRKPTGACHRSPAAARGR